MILTLKDIHNIFVKLINNRLSLEEADRWAYKVIEEFDNNTLIFDPKKYQDHMWRAVSYLYGVDLKISPNEYMHSLSDIEEYYNNWCNTIQK